MVAHELGQGSQSAKQFFDYLAIELAIELSALLDGKILAPIV